MRSVLCAALLGLPALPAPAADPPKPNTLTPQEIARGVILLFDGETAFGWKVDGEVKVENGALVLGGTKPTKAETTSSFLWLNTIFSMEAKWEGAKSPVLFFGGQKQPLEDFHKGKFAPVAGGITGTEELPPSPVKVEVPEGTTLSLRNIKYPSAGKPIFNGKDLTGWKEFPAKKSKFTITPEGWLNIKDGPGDLQTVDQWDDFILHLECISNGKHLNSGVFFRCRPNEYQNGYEAQIHNGFTAQPAKDYTIEEYDPVTHKLVNKQKVKYAAIDYGTGAIYRRMPARRQVARDNEWFSMTILAQGKHLAVWVNGIQVADWTDNRPPSDNARNGCKLEKGPISLQGHDPTTNLSFRNISVRAMPNAKK